MRKETINYYSQTRPEVAAFVPIITKSIIDIGCSDGDFLQFVKKQTGAETWGIESVPELSLIHI